MGVTFFLKPLSTKVENTKIVSRVKIVAYFTQNKRKNTIPSSPYSGPTLLIMSTFPGPPATLKKLELK